MCDCRLGGVGRLFAGDGLSRVSYARSGFERILFDRGCYVYGGWPVYSARGREVRVDVIYRFFEPSIAQHSQVGVDRLWRASWWWSRPHKHYLEEAAPRPASHEALRDYWLASLGEEGYGLSRLFSRMDIGQ